MAFPPPNTQNFILIPLMAPGHIIPMIDMAKLLAKRGVTVSIVVTPVNAARFTSVIDRAASSGLPIRLLQIRFPAEEAGLPPGCESADSLPSYHLIRNFFVAVNLLQKPFEDMLLGLSPGPSCIICDKHLSWTADTCDKFRIPRIIFDGMGCFAQLIMQRLISTKAHEKIDNPSEPFLIPDLPDRIEFTRNQLPGYFNPGPTYVGDFREEVVKTESRAYGVVSNSFEELENGYLDEYKKLKSGKVWCIGPLSLCNGDGSLDTAQRGNGRAGIDTDKCLKWLDSREPGSVVYACHGSLGRLSPGQFAELASGLEISGRAFVLVVKGGDKIDGWISGSGFEERVKERGLLIRGWAPQVMILSHGAIGGFLTHCGWNSTLEGICAGVPMITWPIFAEQFLNEKLVVQVLRVGVGVGAEGVMHLEEAGNNDDHKYNVGKEKIRRAIESVMDEGNEGCERRKRVKELAKVAEGSVREGGSSSRNVELLIQEIAQLVIPK